MKKLIDLFLTFAKIGAFTFGGGYAMIALLDHECVDKKQWITEDELSDVTVIAESTPGPIAINSATYIGYKRGGVLGSVACTVGVCIPSIAIIFAISLFFDRFLSIAWVAAAFRGIQACVIFLILSAGLKLLKKLPRTPLCMILFGATLACMVSFSLFAVKFSTIFYILIGAAVGVMVYLIGLAHSKRKKGDEK